MNSDQNDYPAELYSEFDFNRDQLEFLDQIVGDGLYYVDFENNNRNWVSPAFWRLLGYDSESMGKLDFKSHASPKDYQKWVNQVRSKEDEVEKAAFVLQMQNRNGIPKYISCKPFIARDESGTPIRLLAVLSDETDSIHETEMRQACNEAANIGFWDYDVTRDKLRWSTVAREIHEVPANYEPRVENAKSFYLKADQKIIDQCVEEAINSGLSYDKELRIKTYKGNVKWIRTLGICEVVNGKTVRVYGTLQDMTEPKQKEIQVELSEKRFRNSFNHAAIGMALVSPEGHVFKVNEALNKMLGYSETELKSYHFRDITHPDDIEKDLSLFYEVLQNKRRTYRLNKRYIHKKGHLVYGQLAVSAVRDAANQVLYFISQIVDVTNLIQGQRKLEEANSLLNEAQRIGKMGAWAVDLKTDKMLWSEEVYRIHRVPLDFTTTLETGFSMYSQEEQDKILEAVEKAIDEKRMFDLKARLNRSDGQKLKVQLTGFPVEVDGEVVQIKGMIRDITQEEADKLSIEREQNFSRQLIESMQEGVLILSPEGEVVSINPAFSRMTGYTSEEIIGQNGTCPYWPEEEYETLREAERILRQNGKGDFELTFKRKSGERFPVICKASSIYNEDYEVELHFANITDVSSIKEAQDKIEQNIRFQQVIFDTIPAYVLVKDKSFQVVKANQRFIDMYPNEVKAHLMASTSLEMYPPTDRANFLREDRKALADGFSEVEEEITFPNGNTKTLLTRKVRFYGQQKEPYILVLATDITELKTLEKEKERLQQKTQDQNSRLRNFARIVSHNLRTHVGGIGSLLKMVQKNQPEIFEQQEFQLLYKASQNLQQTISDLTQVVQAELDAEPLQRGNLYKCVEKNIEAVKPQAEEQKIKILNEVAQDIYVQAIPAYLDSIIINFLTNAIKYADEEKPSRWIRLTAKPDESFVRFECSDNGMGIDLEKNRDRIFGMYQTFHQHEDSRGVGLYMTKTQVESMGGKIDVKSQVGKGTSFTASFLLDK